MKSANHTQYSNLLAVDPSLTCSGWALFSIEDRNILAVGKLRSLPVSHGLAQRLKDLHLRIEDLFTQFSLSHNSIVVCEAPTTMRDPSAAIKVEQVRGIFEVIARSRQSLVPGRINPRSVQYEVLGLKGKQLTRPIVKQSAVFTAERLFKAQLTRLGFPVDSGLHKHQDIVDALLIGSLALDRIASAQRNGEEIQSAFESSVTATARSSRGKWAA